MSKGCPFRQSASSKSATLLQKELPLCSFVFSLDFLWCSYCFCSICFNVTLALLLNYHCTRLCGYAGMCCCLTDLCRDWFMWAMALKRDFSQLLTSFHHFTGFNSSILLFCTLNTVLWFLIHYVTEKYVAIYTYIHIHMYL